MNTGKIQPRLLKGFRDFPTREMLERNYVIGKIRKVIESYGFDPLETPTLEYADVLLGNIGEDEKLIYKFMDDGDRQVALKYDQTVGTCRYIAMHYSQVPIPFKRYSIANVYRAENTQKGRYREFLQFDADIFGIDGVGADIEMILLSCDIYTALGFTDFKVYVSDRALVKDIPYIALAAVDKLDKVGEEGVLKELENKGITDPKGTLDKVINAQANDRVNDILEAARDAGMGDKVVFDPTIMRSFSYSTGTIWEVKADGYRSSLLGGERFDSLVSRFSNQEVSGVGFGIGFDRTIEVMREKGLLPTFTTNSKILVTTLDERYYKTYLEVSRKLRDEGFNVELYPVMGEKIGKQYKYADRKGIEYVLTIGEEEIQNGTVSLKNLISRYENILPLDEAIVILRK